MESCCSVYDDEANLLLKTSDLDYSLYCLQDSPSFHSHLQPPSASSTSMVNFKDANNTTSSSTATTQKRAPNSEDEAPFDAKKRRLGSAQVRYLEKSFEADNKLEPDRKARLARELGLEPRQVAIWFQNRRARCKTKLLHKDYDSLKSSYDRLKRDCDALCSENEKLRDEVNTLEGKLQVKEEKGSDELKEEPRGDDDDDDYEQVKQSNASSVKSDVLDSDSPRRCCPDGIHDSTTAVLELERGDSSHVYEAAEATISDYDGEDGSVGRSLILEAAAAAAPPPPPPCFLKLEVAAESSCYEDDDYLQPNSCNLGFPVLNRGGTWFWEI